MNFSGTRFFAIFVETPNISPEAHPITVMSIPPQIIPPKSGGKESMINHDNTSSGLISMPLARTVSPIHVPRRPIGGIKRAEANAPFLAV